MRIDDRVPLRAPILKPPLYTWPLLELAEELVARLWRINCIAAAFLLLRNGICMHMTLPGFSGRSFITHYT
jgi:hypothetical protein